MLKNLLKSFHLTDKEILVFLKVLTLGMQPASTIARVCELPRNTVRGILDNLVKKGLLVRTQRANVQLYATEGKENLQKTLIRKQQRQQEETDRQLQLLEEYGSELMSHQWARSRPRITFYEGEAGVEKVYEDTLTSKTGLRSWGSYDANKDALPDYFKTYYARRTKKGVRMKSIHPDTELSRKHQQRDKEELRESALVPTDRFNITPEIQMYDGKVNIVSWKEKLGIIIESQEIADALQDIFELSYEAAKAHGHFTTLDH
jgi:sugar-specific transcriptional regulator TrmB